ncbi:MAG: CDP-glucose 4,6-dehydratase [Deltaproteobacteria bacterium]|nr:CDP-glucose 4,6-dehydratase [Deltaproteobacteria bacterium]
MSEALAAYAGARVLVTGDTGFKGAWLAYWLHRLGARVFGYALPPLGARDLFEALALSDLVRHVDGDVRDLAAVRRAVVEAEPDFVFHLAAQALVKPSYDDPVGTFATNVQGTVHVLEAVRGAPSVRSVVVITSDKCYRNREWSWGYRESDELGGHDPYSASKAAAEIVFASYRDAYFAHAPVGLASARAGNVIGGGDEAPDRIVPDCVRALRSRVPLVLRRPAARRPWQHVLEPLAGYLLLGQRLVEDRDAFGGSWNFGPRSDAIETVREVAERIVALWGERVPLELGSADFHETHALRLSIDKATSQLGWRPRWGFDATVANTVAWYRAAERGEDMRAFTAAQIEAYMHDEVPA